MDSALRLEVSERIVSLELYGGRLDSGVLPFEDISDRHFVTVPLSPTHVHTHKHRRPVIGFGAACPGIDGKYRPQTVAFFSEHVTEFKGFYVGLSCPEGFFKLLFLWSGQFLGTPGCAFFCKIIKDIEVGRLGSHFVISAHPEFHGGKLFQKLFGFLGIIPETRLESTGLLPVHFGPFGIYIQALFQGIHPGLETFYLFCSNHILQRYGEDWNSGNF